MLYTIMGNAYNHIPRTSTVAMLKTEKYVVICEITVRLELSADKRLFYV